MAGSYERVTRCAPRRFTFRPSLSTWMQVSSCAFSRSSSLCRRRACVTPEQIADSAVAAARAGRRWCTSTCVIQRPGKAHGIPRCIGKWCGGFGIRGSIDQPDRGEWRRARARWTGLSYAVDPAGGARQMRGRAGEIGRTPTYDIGIPLISTKFMDEASVIRHSLAGALDLSRISVR